MSKSNKVPSFESLLKRFKKLERDIEQCKSQSSRLDNHSEVGESEHARPNSKDPRNLRFRAVRVNVADLDDYTVEDDQIDEPSNVMVDEPHTELNSPESIPNVDAIPGTSYTVTLANRPSYENQESLESVPDDTILKLLGEDPTATNTYGTKIHKDLAVRLEHIATNGLSKEVRQQLTEKYLLPSNCKLIDAPKLNPEMKAAISKLTAKQDKNIEYQQKQNAAAISCLSQVINIFLAGKKADPTVTQMLMDTERILCDLQHRNSLLRRSSVLKSLRKDMGDQLRTTKVDNMLFGKNLRKKLKVAKAINKSGADLRPLTPRQTRSINKKSAAVANTHPARTLNFKAPHSPRTPPDYSKQQTLMGP